MAFIVMVLDVPSDSIAQLNSKYQLDSTKQREVFLKSRDLMEAIASGAVDASMQITVRDTDPAVATSGSGSSQISYNLK